MKSFHPALIVAALCLSGCFRWGSRASSYLPENAPLSSRYSYDGEVLIIGAGASGLAAARVFEDNNVRYTILEATERYGGRLSEDTQFAEFPIDLGAEWIHNNAEILDVLSGQTGTAAATELIPHHLTSGLNWDGNEATVVSQYVLDAMFYFFPEYKFKTSTWFNFVETHYASRVKERIRYNSAVTSIDFTRPKVEVLTQDGTRFVADKVLVTVSIVVLKADAIAFNPPLSERKREAIDDVKFLPGFKLFLKFSEDFFPDVINGVGEAVPPINRTS